MISFNYTEAVGYASHSLETIFPTLHSLYNSCLQNLITNHNVNEYNFTVIILDIVRFKPAGIKNE